MTITTSLTKEGNNMRGAMLLGTTLLLVMSFGCAEQTQPAPETPARQPQEAASKGLETLQKMITPENFKAMGFESLDEVKSAALGAPLELFHVRLDQLREFQSGTDPNQLLTNVGQMIYPVTVQEQSRSSIMVAKDGETWKAVRFGGPGLIKTLAQVRKESPPGATAAATSPPFLVQVPALNVYFLGNRSDKGLMLTPLLDDPALKFKAGTPMPAAEALAALVPVAKAYNGLPN
jgi:hypothetical protein